MWKPATLKVGTSAQTEASLPAVVGLLVAWGGTAVLVSPISRSAGEPSSVVLNLLGQAALWLLCAAVIGIIVFWERKPIESIWLKPLRWQSLARAGVLILGSIFVLFPATEWVRNALGLSGYAAGMQSALSHPLWLRLFSVLTAGVVEETLFHGYAVTRLVQLTGSLVFAVGASSIVFAALHLPLWGAGPSLSFLIGGLATTAFFAWQRDLLAMIIAHVAVDAWGLVITPSLSQWWA